MDSAATLGTDMLIQKLGHNLSEIRCRSLQSITSKLEHGLLSEADLVQERLLFRHLLEWFNFEPCPMQGEVLELLVRLTKHTSACDVLGSLGAAQFFNDLRKDMEPDLKPRLDTLLDRLFHVKDSTLASGRHCTYRATCSADGPDLVSAAHHDTAGSGFFSNDDDKDVTERDASIKTQNTVAQRTTAEDISFVRFPGFPWHFLTATDRHVLTSTSSSLCSPNPHLVQNACLFLLDVVFKDFPAEIFLQRPTILNTLITLLGSRPNGSLMMTVCECLSLVTQNLASRVVYFQDPSMFCPRQGLPVWSSAFRHSFREDSRPIRGSSSRMEADGHLQERNGGDGREQNSSSTISHTVTSSILETQSSYSTFEEDDKSLEDDRASPAHLAQISVQALCTSLLKYSIPLLQTDSASVFLKVHEVVTGCIHLIEGILDPQALWNCDSASAQQMQSDLNSLCERMGEAVLYHYHLNCPDAAHKLQIDNATGAMSGQWSLKYESRFDAVQHRLAFNACAALTMRFLKAVLPVDEAGSHVGDSLSTALYVISCDEPLASLCGDVRAAAEGYLELCEGEQARTFANLRRVMKSFSCAHQLIQDCSNADRNLKSCLELAECCIECLPHYVMKGLISSLVSVISETCNKSLNRSSDGSQHGLARKILLRLLAHPVVRIRSEAYKVCLNFVQSCVEAAGNKRAETMDALTFIMHHDVLYEICLHGIPDSSLLTSTPAQELVLLLLQGSLLMDEAAWEYLKTLLKPVLPVIQAFQGDVEMLRTAVFGLVSVRPGGLEDCCKVQCLLRSLMIRQRSVRNLASGILTQVLQTMGDEVTHGTLITLVQRASCIVGLTDLLMVSDPVSLIPTSTTSSAQTGLFHEDAVIRALGIFRSQSIDSSVRKSALQQLAVMLVDSRLHDIFLRSDGLQTIRSHLVNVVVNNTVLTEGERAETDACITILKSVMLWDREILLSFRDDQEILFALLVASDLCRLSPVSFPLVVSTLALLLFCDVLLECKSDVKVTGRSLSLPAAVVNRYQVPFLCPSHHVISVHRASTLFDSGSNPLASGPPQFAMLIHLQLMTHDHDVAAALTAMDDQMKTGDQQQSSKPAEVSLLGKASVTLADYLALAYSFPGSCMEHLTTALAEADSHDSVHHYVSLTHLLLKAFPSEYCNVLLKSLSWRTVMRKFLATAPSSSEDEALLFEIVNLLDALFKAEYETRLSTCNRRMGVEDTLMWIIDICTPLELTQESLRTEKPLFMLLKSTDTQGRPFASSAQERQNEYLSMAVRRQLCKVTLSMLSRVAKTLSCVSDQGLVHKFQVSLCQVLLIRLKLADAPQFYDLPSMEVSLECLLHVTASWPGWTRAGMLTWRTEDLQRGSPDLETILCRQLTSTLLEVVSAFHIESRGSNKSYMGKGVSRCATMSIVSLAYEVLSNHTSAHELPKWLASFHPQSISSSDDRSVHNQTPTPYGWMLPLWSARDPRIRHSGVALAVVLSRSVEGCIALATSFEQWYGGLWNMSFGVLCDESECSAVREQATALLCNLVSHEFRVDSVVHANSHWLGPVLREDGSDKIVSGVPALVMLLRSSKFFRCIANMNLQYYPDLTIQPAMTVYTPFYSETTRATSTQTGLYQEHEDREYTTGGIDQGLSRGRNTRGRTSSRQSPVYLDRSSEASLNSFESVTTEAWHAVCTPSLIANVCRLLQNLISVAGGELVILLEQNDIIGRMVQLVNVQLLSSSLENVKLSVTSEGNLASPGRKAEVDSHAVSLISQHVEICKMLHKYILHRVHARVTCMTDQDLKEVLSLLTVVSPTEHWGNLIWEMQISVMDLISLLAQDLVQYGEGIASVISIDPLSTLATLQRFLSVQKNGNLLLSSLKFLNGVLNCLRAQAKDIKDPARIAGIFFSHQTSEADLKALCEKLIEIFSEFLTKPSTEENLKFLAAASNALQSFFLLSSAAKNVAISSGFLEATLSEIKRLLAKLELYRLHGFGISKVNTKTTQAANNNESDIITRNITFILRVLTNFVHGSQETRVLASNSDLPTLLMKLLSWASIHPSLLRTVLRLVMSYSASCEDACASLAWNISGQQSSASHIIVIAKELTAQVLSGGHVEVEFLRLVYNLLCNLSVSSECRSTMWKASFLTIFPNVADKGQHPRCSKRQLVLLSCWLKLIHSLSFHSDGQLNILKIPDVLDILAEIRVTRRATSDRIVAILRNLCFHAPNKHRISASKAIIQIFEEELCRAVNSKSSTVAASAFYALLVGNNKAKVHLKGAGLQAVVQKLLCVMEPNSGDVMAYGHLHTSLKGVLEILQS